MYIVFKSEVLHRRKYLAQRIGNLCHGRYLPVAVPAINCYIKGIVVVPTEKHLHINFLIPVHDIDIAEPEALCCVHELQETRNRKHELFKESNLQAFEARGRDLTNNRFQVSANASKPEIAKVRKCNVCR